VFWENEMERRKVRHYISLVGLGLQASKRMAGGRCGRCGGTGGDGGLRRIEVVLLVEAMPQPILQR